MTAEGDEEGCGGWELCWTCGEGGQKEEGPSAKNLPEKPTLCPTSGNRAWKALTWPAVPGAAPRLPEYVWVGPFGIRGWRGVGAQMLSCM